MNQQWTTGVFTTTPAFAAIQRHVCVLEAGTNRLIAICGSIESPESVVLAQLFAATPELRASGEAIHQHLLVFGSIKRDSAAGQELFNNLHRALQKAQGHEETGGVA